VSKVIYGLVNGEEIESEFYGDEEDLVREIELKIKTAQTTMGYDSIQMIKIQTMERHTQRQRFVYVNPLHVTTLRFEQ